MLSAALLAVAVPSLLAYSLSPSATLINQCLAVALWGGFALLLPASQLGPALRRAWPLAAVLVLLAAAALGSWGWGSLPWSLAAAALSVLAPALLLALLGAAESAAGGGARVWSALAWGLLVAGIGSALVALVQVFMPRWADGMLVAHSALVGRAVGNLRQPNHLCSLLLWALVSAVSLHELGQLPRRLLWPIAVLLVFAVELSASRTGAVGLLLLPLWALLDRRLSPAARRLLLMAPLVYALAYAAMAGYGHFSSQAVGAGARIAAEASAAAQSTNSRWNVWGNTWALVRAQPWTGVGFGEYNLAWTLTPFAHRPTAYFDHAHNLPLHLMAELGVPLALLVLALLGQALLLAWRRCARLDGQAGIAARSALAAVLMILLHSLVEYPLWYSYFLLPSALAWGVALGAGWRQEAAGADPRATVSTTAPASRLRLNKVGGLVMVVCASAALVDYLQITAIYAPSEGDSRSLSERIARGQRSPLFAHHADYAAATNAIAPPAQYGIGLQRAVHNLLDTRLMIAWARAQYALGQVELARALAQRVGDFGHAEAADLLGVCADKPLRSAPDFPCRAAQATHDWREFIAPAALGSQAGPGQLAPTGQPASATP